MDFIIDLSLCPADWDISLFHFFRKPSSSEELMGKKFVEGQPSRMMAVLERAKEKLVEKGFPPENIKTELIREPCQTIADGIMDQVKKRHKEISQKEFHPKGGVV